MTTSARSSQRPSVDEARLVSRQILGFGPVTLGLTSTDSAAAAWLVEVLHPWFTPTVQAADWHVRLWSVPDAHADLCRRRPPAAASRACFALDTFVVSLPAWSDDAGVTLADDKRCCFLVVNPFQVDLIGAPASRRWRFTLMTVFHEIVATQLRRTELDIHAAAVETAGRSLLIIGPKGAGKTTLSFHLLRSGLCRSIANDRVFASVGASGVIVRGVPTAVRLHPAMIAEFPELLRDVPAVERPYLYSHAELTQAHAAAEHPDPYEVALSPAQLVRQLNAEPLGSAPLGAVVFPEIRTDVDGSAVERLDPRRVSAEIWANLYGCRSGPRPATVFEEISGGMSQPSRSVASALAESVHGYRIVLGQRAYDQPGFAARLLDVLFG